MYQNHVHKMTEEQVVKGCQKNNPVAQRQLYDMYSKRVLGICLRYSKERSEAEDLMQNAFIKVFESINQFRGNGSLEGWVRKITVNMAFSSLRKNKIESHSLNLDDDEYLAPSVDYISESLDAKDLLKLIQTLPSGFRTVFNLFAIEGYSHKEIGEMLGISEGTSKSQYSRARTYLQKCLIIGNAV